MDKTCGNYELVLAAITMGVAVFYDGITLASGDYRSALIIALVALAISDFLCLHQFFSRLGLVRWLPIVIALPTSYVLWDIARRAPYVWHFSN